MREKNLRLATALVLAWSVLYLLYIIFAVFVSGVDSRPKTTNDNIANGIKIILGMLQLGVAIALKSRYKLWLFRAAIALIPIIIITFFLLPFGWWR
jgi:uncharacterized membrane protein (DUF485 family)